MKIVIYGAESTGKTTLCQALAAHYRTVWVPEYARAYLQKKYDNSGEICAIEDLIPIAKGQIRAEKKLSKMLGTTLYFAIPTPIKPITMAKLTLKILRIPNSGS